MDRMLAATAATEDRHFWFRGLRRTAQTMLRRANVPNGLALVVDCGTGTGRNLDWLSAYGPSVGVDLTPLGLRIGRRKGRRLIRGSVTALPIPDESADLATSFDVLYCLDDQSESRALQEMWRVLKPGGRALINVAALDMLRGSHSTLTHEVRRYSPRQLREKLTAVGFAVEHTTFTNMSLFGPMLAVRGLQRLTGRADQPSDADLALPSTPVNTMFDACLRVEAGLLRHVNLPIGTSVMALARRQR